MTRPTSTRSGTPQFDIGLLLTPAAYPHRVDTLALRETHMSWLVLTGPFAYKIKKPVRFGFVDASTLARRQFLCDEELRLNRRLAAELYVDVVPITADEDCMRIGGAGPPLEYAVRMRQFPPDDEMLSLVAAGRVSRDEILALAEDLSRFHVLAAAAPWRNRFVHTNRLLDAVLVNIDELIAQLQHLAPELYLKPLLRWVCDRIERDRSSFEQRERTGQIRECHGDLHLGNIVRYGGRLLPFDCLEFDPDLRWIDVIDDIAFLVMDLVSHDRDDLAITLLSRYLECSGDYSGVRQLAFYGIHRALVRAKVDGLSMTAIPARAAEFRERLERRLRAAVRWTQPRSPKLILMHGASGSGKSWLSEQLVSAVGALRVRADIERKRLAGIGADAPAGAPVRAGIYSAQFTHRTYAHLSDCAEHCLQSGFSVIVDATFLDRVDRELFRNLAHRLDATFTIIACRAEAEVLSQRIRARAAAGERTSDADLAVLEVQLRDFQPFDASELLHVIPVDTREHNIVARTAAVLRARAPIG
jgi:uncharacterized protein